MFRAECCGLTADQFWQSTPAELKRAARVMTHYLKQQIDQSIFQAWYTARFSREKILYPLQHYTKKQQTVDQSQLKEEVDLEERRREHEELVSNLKVS